MEEKHGKMFSHFRYQKIIGHFRLLKEDQVLLPLFFQWNLTHSRPIGYGQVPMTALFLPASKMEKHGERSLISPQVLPRLQAIVPVLELFDCYHPHSMHQICLLLQKIRDCWN